MTDAERIAFLEEAVVTARREASVVSLQLLAVISSNDASHYTSIKMRLTALEWIVDGALEQLELLYEEQGDAQESR